MIRDESKYLGNEWWYIVFKGKEIMMCEEE